MAKWARLWQVQVSASGFGLVGSFAVVAETYDDATTAGEEWADEHGFSNYRVSTAKVDKLVRVAL